MTLVCAIVVFVKLPESRPETHGGGRRTRRRSRRSGCGTVLRDGRFMSVVGLSFLVALIFQQGSSGCRSRWARTGFTSSDFGMAIAVNGVLIVALQIPVTRFIEHRDPRRLLIISSLLAGYGFGLTAFAGSIGVYALTVCVWTLAEIVNAPTQTGLVVRLSPAARPRPLPGHVHAVLVGGRAGRPAAGRLRHRPVRGGVAVGHVRGARDGGGARVLAADARPAARRTPPGRRASTEDTEKAAASAQRPLGLVQIAGAHGPGRAVGLQAGVAARPPKSGTSIWSNSRTSLMPTVALYGAIPSILTRPARSLVTVTFQWVNRAP